MVFVQRPWTVFVLGAALLAGLAVAGCASPPRLTTTVVETPDPLVAAALKFSHGTSGTIEAYRVDYVVDVPPNKTGHVPPGAKTELDLTVMKDGSLWYPLNGMTPDFPPGDRPLVPRAQPEPASARAAREKTLSVAHLNLVRGSRRFVGASAMIERYYVRVQLKSGASEIVGINPDGALDSAVVWQAYPATPWPHP